MSSIRQARPDDWLRLWPLLEGMGVKATQQQVRDAFLSIAADQRWLVVVAPSGERPDVC